MLVKFGDKYLYNQKKALIIIFKDDEERLKVAHQLLNMEPKEGLRMYSQRDKQYITGETIEQEFDKIESEIKITADGFLSFESEHLIE